jgi:hypothetical protein
MISHAHVARNRAFFGSFASIVALALTSPAMAQDQPAPTSANDEQNIIVTATKRETSLLEVPSR